MLKMDAVAARLNVGRRTAYRLAASGDLKAVRVGSRGLRVSAAELERFVSAGGAGAAGAHLTGDTTND